MSDHNWIIDSAPLPTHGTSDVRISHVAYWHFHCRACGADVWVYEGSSVATPGCPGRPP